MTDYYLVRKNSPFCNMRWQVLSKLLPCLLKSTRIFTSDYCKKCQSDRLCRTVQISNLIQPDTTMKYVFHLQRRYCRLDTYFDLNLNSQSFLFLGVMSLPHNGVWQCTAMFRMQNHHNNVQHENSYE